MDGKRKEETKPPRIDIFKRGNPVGGEEGTKGKGAGNI